MKYNIPFIKPAFPRASEIAEDYATIVESNWFTNFGPFEQEFSKKAEQYLSDNVSVSSVANATLGLYIAIQILFDKNKAKRILVPSFTFAAGPEMLILSGFTPVYIDIEKDSWQPSIDQARLYLQEQRGLVGGILLCNIFGVGNTAIDQWESLAKEFRIPLIIDSAAGFGSLYTTDIKVGTRGDCEVFSLHATKPFSVGEGGLLVSKNTTFIENVRSFQNFGFNSARQVQVVGINAKMQELNAAIGIRQLRGFDARLTSRRESLAKYKAALLPLGCEFQLNDDNSTVPFVSVTMKTKELSQKVQKALQESGVEARKYYEPLHRQEILMNQSEKASDLNVTNDLFERIVSLPLHDSMTQSDIDKTTTVIVQCHE